MQKWRGFFPNFHLNFHVFHLLLFAWCFGQAKGNSPACKQRRGKSSHRSEDWQSLLERLKVRTQPGDPFTRGTSAFRFFSSSSSFTCILLSLRTSFLKTENSSCEFRVCVWVANGIKLIDFKNSPFLNCCTLWSWTLELHFISSTNSLVREIRANLVQRQSNKF